LPPKNQNTGLIYIKIYPLFQELSSIFYERLF